MLGTPDRAFGDPILKSRALAVAVIVLAGLTAWLVRDRGGLLALGLFAGVLAAFGVAVVLATLRPIGAVLDAARPLGVPVLLIVSAGTVDSPLLVQLAAGIAAMLIAVRFLIQPEWTAVMAWTHSAWTVIGTRETATQTTLWRRVAIVAVLALLIAAYVLPPGGTLEARGGPAAYLFALAVLLVGVAAALRLVGYVRTAVKLPVAVLAFLAGGRVGMQLGLVPGDTWLDGHVPIASAANLVVLAAVALALTVAVAVDVWGWVTSQHHNSRDKKALHVAVWLERPILERTLTEGASALGLIAAVASAVTLFAALVVSATPGVATGALAETIGGEPPDAPAVRPSAQSDIGLARTYMPMLLFSHRAQWTQVAVDDYLQRAGDAVAITDWNQRSISTSTLPALDDCPSVVPAPCYRLTIGCAGGEHPCTQQVDPAAGDRLEDGTVYVRVLRRGAPMPDHSPNPFDSVGPYGGRTRILVQYWFFYPYDEWVSPVMAGQLRQRHEADWEALTIGFSDTEPLFVGFSQHCGGQWYPWRQVRVASTQRPRLRTLVAVADGSQANYRYPNRSQAPDWTGCANLPARTLTLVSYASNIRDRTGVDWSWSPERYVLVDASKPPMNFVGRWAPYSRTELETLYQTRKLGPDAAGPATPSLQVLWREPMRTIFKSAQWHAGPD